MSEFLWRRDLGRALETAPVFCQGDWLAAVTEASVVRLAGETGETVWKHKLPASPRQAPVMTGSVAVLCTDLDEPVVLALDLATGREVWRRELYLGLAAASDSVLVATSRQGTVARLHPGTGEEVWRIELEGAGWRAPVIRTSDTLAVFSVRPDSVVALDLRTGDRRWSVRVGAWPRPGSGPILAVAADDSTLVVLAPESGEVRSRYRLPAMAAGAPVSDDGTVYLAVRDGTVLALEGSSGAPRWAVVLDPPLLSGPCLAETTLYQSGSAGMVYGISRESGQSWPEAVATERILASPAVAADHLAVPGAEGTLTLFRRKP